MKWVLIMGSAFFWEWLLDITIYQAVIVSLLIYVVGTLDEIVDVIKGNRRTEEYYEP